jgi:hypothetical protein
MDAGEDLGRRQHLVHAPAVGRADVHELDEAQDVAAVIGSGAPAARSPSLVPRLTTMLTLIGARPAAAAASMPSSTSPTGKSTSFMRLKTASSSAVEADRDAVQAGILQGHAPSSPAASRWWSG